ncbi:MAG TPA: IS21 family transposase [Burkholderiaceae bacterium]|nr:IS21 family transposase [Burkholderiaceae bacterium]
MRLPVHLQREIARLHFYDPNQSSRALARATGISANTVRALRERLHQAGLEWDALKDLDDDAWTARLNTKNRSIAQRKEAPDWEWVHAEMQRPDATLEQLWREWKEDHPAGIAYTQFTTGYGRYCNSLHVVMRQVHRPGEKLFVDFAGRTVEIKDPNGGPPKLAQVFVAVLGCSNKTYIEAVASQTTADWIRAHVNCFRTLGGVAEWIVSDNLKAAVWRRERDRIVINPAYRDCLRHYDTAALPAGARKPRHKAKAEVGVQIAQRWVLFALRDRTFFSLDELNEELRRLTDKLNRHPFKVLPGCREERFLQLDQPALKPLPSNDFELCDWSYGVLVKPDHHVEHEQCFYSVAPSLIGARVDLRTTASVVEAFHRGRRVALHPRLATPGDVSTLDEHRPVAHRRVLDGEPRQLATWAATLGTNAQRLILHHLEDRRDITNGVKAARRLRELARLYGDERFEEVCAYALRLNMTSLRSISSILKTSPDKRRRDATPARPRPDGDVRGAQYFGESA